MNPKILRILAAILLVSMLTLTAIACAKEDPKDKDSQSNTVSNTSETEPSTLTTDPVTDEPGDETDPQNDKMSVEGANTDDRWDDILAR